MAGFANLGALEAALDGGQFFRGGFVKQTGNQVTHVAGQSSWAGTFLQTPGAGSNPATTPGTAYNSEAGGIVFPDTAPLQKHLCHFTANMRTLSTAMVWQVVDRLVGVSGISLASTGDKTINSVALPRYTSGVGVMAFLEVTTTGTSTTCQFSMNSYTNQDGTTGRAGPTQGLTTGNSAVAGTLVGPIGLATGDTGIRSIETINVSVAATTTVVTVLLVKPLIFFGGRDAAYTTERASPFPYTIMPRIYDGATLEVLIHANNPDVEVITGSYRVAVG